MGVQRDEDQCRAGCWRELKARCELQACCTCGVVMEVERTSENLHPSSKEACYLMANTMPPPRSSNVTLIKILEAHLGVVAVTPIARGC